MVKVNNKGAMRAIWIAKIVLVAILFCVSAVALGEWSIMDWHWVPRVLFGIVTLFFVFAKVSPPMSKMKIAYDQRDMEASFYAGLNRGVTTAEGHSKDSTPTFGEWIDQHKLLNS